MVIFHSYVKLPEGSIGEPLAQHEWLGFRQTMRVKVLPIPGTLSMNPGSTALGDSEDDGTWPPGGDCESRS